MTLVSVVVAMKEVVFAILYFIAPIGSEDTHHVVTQCPAYHAILTVNSGQLKKSIIDNSDAYMWNTHFSDWENFLRIIICPDIILVIVPELFSVISSVEDVSRDYLY